MERVLFGKTADGREVDSYIFRNAGGMEVRCITYGCAITNLFLPAAGGPVDVVLGYDSLAGYETDTNYHGRFIGRYANRIKDARFSLNGQEYALLKNNNGNYLHGSLHNRVFNAEIIGDNSVTFTTLSPSGEDGFPGELWVSVTYTLTDENELLMDYRARSDADTHVNLTNHSYFNLAGAGNGTIEDHILLMNCSRFLEAGPGLIPTGRVLETAGGAFDFSHEKPIGQDINGDDPQLKAGGGYDHCFIIDREVAGHSALAAHLTHPESGRQMRVYTTQPGVQLYAGNGLSGKPGKDGLPMARRGGLCLETQHFPATPNELNPDFPPTLLRAGEKYHQSTVLRFNY